MSDMTHKHLYDELEKRRQERIDPQEKLYEVTFSLKFVAKNSLTKEQIAKVSSFLIGVSNEDRETYKDPKDLEYKSMEIKSISSFKYYN
tara:strand:+ start:860 stop:1126 length:267 start_codon:yes stop_codon:yes gene_type:complete